MRSEGLGLLLDFGSTILHILTSHVWPHLCRRMVKRCLVHVKALTPYPRQKEGEVRGKTPFLFNFLLCGISNIKNRVYKIIFYLIV